MMSKKNRIKALKSAYNRQWYLANRMYKKTYSRFYHRAMDDTSWMWHSALVSIVTDRRGQIEKGRWIDERTGDVYRGVKER